MIFVRKLAFVPLFLLGTTSAFAIDVAVTSKIDSVSVYPDGASVTRVIDFEAPAGEATLVTRDLPENIDPDSVRVDAQGASGVTIASIDTVQEAVSGWGSSTDKDDRAAKEYRDLMDRREELSDAGNALNKKKNLIERFADSVEFNTAKNGNEAANLRSIWSAVGDDLVQVSQAIRQNTIQLRAIDEQLRSNSRYPNSSREPMRTVLRLAVSSERPAKGRVALTYLVRDAGWSPVYDARLDSAAGSVEIIRRAQITQQTGEDWANVAMTVSTARATSGASMPKLGSTIIDFWKEPELLRGFVRSPAPESPAPASSPVAKPETAAADIGSEVAARGREQEAVTNTAGFQSTWMVPGRSTIPSSQASRSLRLATLQVKPDLVARTAPALQQAAYIEASFKNEDATPLFPGPVSVYRDGLYTGQADMPLATHGEPVRLGFGADDRIRIERTVTRRQQGDTGYFSPVSTDQRDYKISLRNGRPGPIRIFVEEAMPVSENKDIKIELSPQSAPPATRDANDRRGVMVWSYDLAAGEAKDILFGYKVSWPTTERITPF